MRGIVSSGYLTARYSAEHCAALLPESLSTGKRNPVDSFRLPLLLPEV